MSDTEQTSEEQSWIDRMLDRDLPGHIRRIRDHASSALTLEWMRTELHGTVLSFLGDIGAFARDLSAWLADHEDRLSDVESYIEALGQETQLVPADANDVVKLAAAMKLMAAESLKSGPQTEEAKSMLAELIVVAERVEKMVARARLDADPDDSEDAAADEGN